MMAKNNKKGFLLLLSILLLLAVTVGGTVAFVMLRTEPVENQFAATYVTSRVNVSGDRINVTNTGNVSAYIRAAIVVNWVDSNGDIRGVAPTAADYTLGINDSQWQLDSDTDFYYCKTSVSAGGTTADLVTSITLNTPAPEGYSLSVEVVADAIQAQGDTDVGGKPAYQDAWGIDLYGSN